MTKLLINTEIYNPDNVKLAIAAYKNHARILMHTKKGQAELLFLHCKYDETRTIREFENYLIEQENAK